MLTQVVLVPPAVHAPPYPNPPPKNLSLARLPVQNRFAIAAASQSASTSMMVGNAVAPYLEYEAVISSGKTDFPTAANAPSSTLMSTESDGGGSN